jgi:hypothetical protein
MPPDVDSIEFPIITYKCNLKMKPLNVNILTIDNNGMGEKDVTVR